MPMSTATRFLTIVTLLVCSANVSAGRLDQSLEILADDATAADSLVAVVAFLENSSSQASLLQASSRIDLKRGDRIRMISARLQSDASNLMSPIDRQIQKFADGTITRHWVVPAYSLTVKAGDLYAVANLSGIDQVVADLPLELTAPVEVSAAPSMAASASAELQLLKIPSLWQAGITGRGRLVCSFDTGVDRLHPALGSKWRGNHASLRASFFSAVAPDSLPFDKTGHGTHTMGIMLGSVDADSFGVAPEAEWITAGVIDQGPDLSTTISHILQAFQWALNPDGNTATTDDVPDVILNSWGLPALAGSAIAPCSTLFWQALDNVEAAGIVTIFAAGNEGKFGAMSIRNPANRATTPYNSFAVGAVNNSKVIADFSSRGPSICDTTQVKPEIVAPGVSIRSSTKGGSYAYMSGTSMAAPYIAGLVALCRQYNPDATVEQIKFALIQSAADLGPTGEDNAYGHGLVDASKLISLLPVPSETRLYVANKFISGDGVAMPGETFQLQIYLTNSAANVEQVSAELISLDPDMMSVTQGMAIFFFGVGGTMATNVSLFSLTANASAIHGSDADLRIRFRTSAGILIDSADFSLPIGLAAPGGISTHVAGSLTMSVSEFGEFGLGEGSIYNAGGDGFSLNGGPNLLYESGIFVGRSSSQLSTAIRDSLGRLKTSDFRPASPGSATWGNDGLAVSQVASFSDNNSSLPIPITVRQESIHYSDPDDDGFVIIKYRVTNGTLEPLTNLHFGILADFDLSAADSVELITGLEMAMQQPVNGGPLTGIVALTDGWFSVRNNGATKTGFTRQQQFGLLSTYVDQPDLSPAGDKMIVLHTGPFSLTPQGSVEVAFAFVTAETRDELLTRAARAQTRFDIPTDVDDAQTLPSAFLLDQNYPNPFNPTTTISFTLNRASQVSLDIFNLLGQQVNRLVDDRLAAGEHRVIWDGTDRSGTGVAAGVYFYRLATDERAESRKMMLLK